MNTLYDVFHYRRAALPASYALDASTLDYYDLTIVLSGRLHYIINDETVMLEEGSLFLLPPGTRRTRLALDEYVQYISFNFRTEEEIELPMPLFMPTTAEILALFRAYSPPYFSSARRGRKKASHIVAYILEALVADCENMHRNPHVLKAIQYIEGHIFEQISLSALADNLGLSREYTSSLFSEKMGMTLSQFINRQKMRRAKEMILDREMSLEEIAHALGYENYGYFSRTFKKNFGVSPRQYKERIRGKTSV